MQMKKPDPNEYKIIDKTTSKNAGRKKTPEDARVDGPNRPAE
jgi:hypothetical protein